MPTGSSPPTTVTIADITNLKELKNLLLPGMYKFGTEDMLDEDAVYPKIFRKRMAQKKYEAVVRFTLLPALSEVKVHDQEVDPGRHFVFNSTSLQKSIIFAVVPESDPRAVSVKKASFVHDIPNYADLKPVRASEFKNAMLHLVNLNRRAREEDAARIFNTADVYDATIGGDGVSLCSLHHPHEQGTWANTFQTQQDLNATSLEAAVEIVKNMKDDRGIRLNINPKTLLVPRQLAAVGLAVVAQSPSIHNLITWDCLTHRSRWFLLNDIDGLTHFVRAPFEVDMWLDSLPDMLLIKSYYRDTFTYIDPRAVFGSLPLA